MKWHCTSMTKSSNKRFKISHSLNDINNNNNNNNNTKYNSFLIVFAKNSKSNKTFFIGITNAFLFRNKAIGFSFLRSHYRNIVLKYQYRKLLKPTIAIFFTIIKFSRLTLIIHSSALYL